MNKKITLFDWGLKDYKEAWEAQEALFQATIDQKTANRSAENPSPTPNYLIFVVVSFTHSQPHETSQDSVCLFLLEKKKDKHYITN